MLLLPNSFYIIKTYRNKGRGVVAKRDIEAGTVIGDYTGTIIKPKSHDEIKTGMYQMRLGDNYDILAHRKEEGLHLLNHSCVNNCDLYPYRGHMLGFTLRHIFKGEELSLNYGMGKGDESEKDIPCFLHTCHCGSKLCTGSMHETEEKFDDWEVLLKHEFGKWYKKVPGKYGSELQPLDEYPASIRVDNPKGYHFNIFGTEKKPPKLYLDSKLPPLPELEKRIQETGRQLSFPKMRLTLYGVRNKVLSCSNG